MFTTTCLDGKIGSHVRFAEPYRHTLPCNETVTSLCCDEVGICNQSLLYKLLLSLSSVSIWLNVLQTDIVCGLESGLIIVFDRKAFSLVKRLDFHRKTVSALAVNSEIIISGSQAR